MRATEQVRKILPEKKGKKETVKLQVLTPAQNEDQFERKMERPHRRCLQPQPVQQLQRLFSSEDALLVVMRFSDPLYMCGDNRVCLRPKEQLFFHKKTILLLWKNIVAPRRRPCFQ
jgi:hypothetical protein